VISRFLIPTFSTLICLLTLVPLDASAQTSADLFNRDAVQEIRLFMNTRDLNELRTKFREDIYYVADLQWRNIRVRNAAVRSRGAISRNPTKPALRIDFNRYTTGQRFLGLRSLVLDNLWQQASFVAESTAMRFFDRLEQPAPRMSFCKLYINNIYHGVYAISEAVDTDFLTRTLGENAGYLFSYQLQEAFFGDYLGDDLSEYKRRFRPQNHELESDAILYAPIRDLFREVNHSDDGVWRDRVEQYIDLRQFVTHVAIENFLAEVDGILGAYSMNNFYLYRFAGTSRHRLIAWDKDTTLSSTGHPIFWNSEQNSVFRRAMAYRDLFDLYLEVLERCAVAAAADDWFENEITRAATLVAPHVRTDPRKPYTDDEFEQAVISILEFARERPAYVLKEVQKIRAAVR
jgi:spore coat protein CotH